LFADARLSAAVSLFQTRLSDLCEMLSRNNRAALKLWRNKLSPLLEQILRVLFEVMERAVGAHFDDVVKDRE
jgi:hypothetical protein